jgi:hypothetical protein
MPERSDAPTCSKCHGKGYQLFAVPYKVTGSGFGDAEERFEPRACDICGGDGRADDETSLIASVAYEIEPFLEVTALGQWAACHPDNAEDDIRATFRWDAGIAWVTPQIRAVCGEALLRHGLEVVEVRDRDVAFHRAVYWKPGPGPDAA